MRAQCERAASAARGDLVHSAMREDAKAKLHTVYQVRARVGPFEVTTSHRSSDFLRLQTQLQQGFPKVRFPPSAIKLKESRLQLQPHRHTEGRMRLLQKYCDDVCALSEVASSQLMVAFFWPSSERGDGEGAVVAPDGSKAKMI